jgi:hypothetical protein
LKKSQLFMEFPFISLSNLKFVMAEKNCIQNIDCCPSYHPLGSGARGGRITRPTLAELQG